MKNKKGIIVKAPQLDSRTEFFEADEPKFNRFYCHILMRKRGNFYCGVKRTNQNENTYIQLGFPFRVLQTDGFLCLPAGFCRETEETRGLLYSMGLLKTGKMNLGGSGGTGLIGLGRRISGAHPRPPRSVSIRKKQENWTYFWRFDGAGVQQAGCFFLRQQGLIFYFTGGDGSRDYRIRWWQSARWGSWNGSDRRIRRDPALLIIVCHDHG